MSKDIRVIRKECCDIWNKLKDKTKMIDYLIEIKREIADLEAKLEESERRYQEYRQMVEKDIEKEIDERMRDTIKEFNLDISQLKQQLAEKEKELLEIKQRIAEKASKEFQEMIYKRENQNQDKISFAVEQLSEIREYVKECWSLDETEGKVRLDIAKKIRLKIEQLKKMK